VKYLPQQFKESINKQIQKREQDLLLLEQKIELYNPKLKYKEGWAEIISNKKRVKLSSIKENEIFTLIDIDTKLDVKCLKKSTL
jgi:exonuclease VII large subunit